MNLLKLETVELEAGHTNILRYYQLFLSSSSIDDIKSSWPSCIYCDSRIEDLNRIGIETSTETSTYRYTAEKIHHILPGWSKNAKKIVMVTGSSGTNRMLGIPHIKEMIYENRKTYAEKHGLEFMWANMTSYNLPDGSPIYWNKIPILKEAFARYPHAEWIWWMDVDIIIMNMSLNIYDHVLSREGMAEHALLDEPIHGAGGSDTGYRTPPKYRPEDINFVISKDAWGMNVGNFLMRRSEWSNWLLDLWIEPLYIAQNWVFPENDAWTHMWQKHKIVQDHALCMDQRSMNAYPEYNFLGEHWQPGDHIVHFAGCGESAQCESEWNKYWEKREKVEVPVAVRNKLETGVAEIEDVQAGEGI